MSKTENTINDWMADYLRSQGLNIITQVSVKLSSGETRIPDFELKNSGVFYGEAEWEKTKTSGWAQAHDYGLTIGTSGTFLIIYPEELKREADQSRIAGNPLDILSKFNYQTAFLRRDKPTDMARLSLQEIPKWLNDNINQIRSPIPDPEQVIATMQVAVRRLTEDLGEIQKLPTLFKNIIEAEPKTKEMRKAISDAAGYILLNQIAFYHILSKERGSQLVAIDPNILKHPSELDIYFSKVIKDINYAPIFAFKASSNFSEKSLDAIKETIKVVSALAIEQIDHDILGKVFHSLIPLSIRKKVAAYYTRGESADLLASLAIEDYNAKVIDPACGSGTLLVASYNRKKELMKTFTDADHRRFLDSEITGVDIMPFAAHLSTIHLAIQQPLYKADNVRIGIEDSTSLKPGMSIPPMSKIIPLSTRQRTLQDFRKKAETVEVGAVGVDAQLEREMNLDYVDVVIMNPPFTRHQSITQFASEYKERLVERFKSYREVISKKMSYCNYFLFLADKFLRNGGIIAAVLPTSILRGKTSEALRMWLLENYTLKYLIVREDMSNFSEDTSFREMLLVVQKGKILEEPASIVFLKELKPEIASFVGKIIKTARRKEKGGENFRLRNIPQNELKYENLFEEIALYDTSLFEIWRSFKGNELLTSFKNLGVEIRHRNEPAQGGGEFAGLCLNFQEAEAMRGDKWILERVKKDSVEARNLLSKDIIDIPKTALIDGFRRITYRGKIDTTELEEYVVAKNFQGSKRFLSLAELNELDWDAWRSWVERRASNICVSTRFNISAPGTCLLSFFSEKQRSWSRAATSTIKGLNTDEAKIISLWLNSSPNILQFLINRMETEGAWMELGKFILENIKVLNIDRANNKLKNKGKNTLTKKQTNKLLNVFDEVSKEEFPSIVTQLIMNSNREDFKKEEISRFSEVFEDFEDLIGKGFTPRRKIDTAILDIIGEDIKVLNDLYPRLLKEIYILKNMMGA